MISKQKPRAAEMLSLMAVLDRQGIPESLLKFDTEPKVDVMTALGTLKAFSLISAGDDGRTYELHRLVQLATRKWLEMQGTMEKWQEKALLAVANMFPSGKFENWPMCEDLMPHAQVVLQYIDKKEIYPEKFSLLLYNVASFEMYQGRYEIAHTRSLAAVQLRTKMFGLEHFKTLNSMSLLAFIYSMQDRLREAETLQIQVMKTCLTKLNEGHPDTLISMNNLASTYHEQERWDEAEKLLIQVMKTSLKVLKAEHPHTLSSMHNLASTYHKQKRWDEAEKLLIEVIEKRLEVLKAEHPDTLRSMHQLACTYYHQDRHEEAIALMKRVIDLSTNALGADHPSTKNTVQWLDFFLDK